MNQLLWRVYLRDQLVLGPGCCICGQFGQRTWDLRALCDVCWDDFCEPIMAAMEREARP